MGQDLELQQHLAELKRSGQPELTRQERITRQRALDKLNVPSFIKTCKVWFGGGEELTRQEHMSTSRGRGRSTSWTSTTNRLRSVIMGIWRWAWSMQLIHLAVSIILSVCRIEACRLSSGGRQRHCSSTSGCTATRPAPTAMWRARQRGAPPRCQAC